MLNEFGKKLESSTENAGMTELDAAFEESGIYAASNEIIAANPEKTCVSGNESRVCCFYLLEFIFFFLFSNERQFVLRTNGRHVWCERHKRMEQANHT